MDKGIQDLGNMTLTQKEKGFVFEQVMKTPIRSPYVPKLTIWSFVHTRFAYTLALLLILVISGGSLAYASENTLPGDLLYPVKVSVTEPVRNILAVTPEAKTQWEATKATRRLDEAEKLAVKNRLTPKLREDIEKRFNKNVSAFEKKMQLVASTSKKRADIDTSFEKSIDRHSDILEKMNFRKDDREQKEVRSLKDTIEKTKKVRALRMNAGKATTSGKFPTRKTSEDKER